jgi:hypothetical protein
LPFEVNVGQTDPSVRFLSHGPGFGLWLTGNQAVFSVARPPAAGAADISASDVFRMTLVGANPNAEVVGLDELPYCFAQLGSPIIVGPTRT